MRLKEYIKMNGYNYKSFAKELDTHYRNIESWAKGDRMPRWAEAEKLFRCTFSPCSVTYVSVIENPPYKKLAD